MRYFRYILLPAFLTLVPLLVLFPLKGRSDDAPSPGSASPKAKASKLAAAEEPHRSPVSLAVSTDGRWVLTANSTADTVSLVDLEAGRVVQELPCGRYPQDIAWTSPRGAAVSLRDDGTVQLLRFHDGQLHAGQTIPVGQAPHGLAVLPAAESDGTDSSETGQSLFVALSGDDEIARISLDSAEISWRVPTGGVPRELCVSPNRKWLLSCCNIPGQLVVHDAANGKELSRRNIFDDGFNLGQPIVLPDSSEVIIPSQINRAFPVNEANIEKGWVIDNRLSRFPLPAGEYWEQKQLNLDPRGAACGDLHAAALGSDGRWLVASAAGSHELLILDYSQAAWPVADPGDFISVELLDREGVFRRVELGGRPLKLQFTGPETVLVANSFGNSLQLVNVAEAKLLQTIDLGGPANLSAVRRGEIIFHDADRSFDSWFSCSTCHPGGHTAGQTFDTLNDGTYDTRKLTPSLHGVIHTSPWTWHGWQTSLKASIRKSLKDTMSSMVPVTDDDVEDVHAYLASLDVPAAPQPQAGSAKQHSLARGMQVFQGKAGCATCHQGERLTADLRVKTGLESSRDFYEGYNPPSLRGLRNRRRFLHDGRGDSLEEVLTVYHQPQRLAGEKLTAEELADLIEYLKSL